MKLVRFIMVPAVLFLLPGIVLPSFTQQTWQRAYGGGGEEMGYSVCQTSDGGFIISGGTNTFGAGDVDVYLIKVNASRRR